MKQAFLVFFAIVVFLLSGCTPSKVVRQLNNPESFKADSKQKFLKVHTKDGSLYLLDFWSIDSITRVIYGTGEYLNYKRDKIDSKPKNIPAVADPYFHICWDDISLLETNRLTHYPGSLAAITVVGVPLGIVSIICIINPKTCFGSCPTFYTLNNGNWQLVAEGFSSSILPVFEKNDIDMLYKTKNTGDSLSVKITNEALETHMIKYANLLAFAQNDDEKVFATPQGAFYRLANLVPPLVCNDRDGNCIDKISQPDHIERYSLTDSKNLAKKEEVIFSFENSDGANRGLIISSRQTLLTTWLFYQGLAWSGNYAGYFASGIENGNKQIKNSVQNLWDKQGGIEIYLKNNNGKWEKIGEVDEMGPIASDFHLIKLPPNIPANATFKLKMTQGLWRIDYLALGKIGAKVEPVTVHPASVIKDGMEDTESLRLLNDTASYLITYPGDSYQVNYKLPGDGKYQFFLESKGYYLEWMRDEWLAEQNLTKAKLMFAFPGLFMRMAAKPFKKTESEMEELFWGSRYVKNE